MKRILTKKDGKWVVLEVNKKPFICPDWLKDDIPFNWKDEKRSVSSNET
jgi:hypothetical protein